ncbi:MAG: N-acetyl-anhydromuramyl-L-alanine amidase AmpD [Myxococcota bacterium]|jgi:N-acetyl-anhydromuramyl-L-alanine amidase AmpD
MEFLSIRSLTAVAAFSLFAAGCETDPLTRPINEVAPAVPQTLDDAASDWDIPMEVLAAIAEAETGFQALDFHEEFEGQPRRIGLMGIPEAHLADAAALAGVAIEDVRTDAPANIAAAAALLDSWAGDIDRSVIGSWDLVLARYSDLPEQDAPFYVHDEIYRRITRGIRLEEMATTPWNGRPNSTPPIVNFNGAGDHPYVRYRPSPNSSTRPSGSSGNVSAVIIHTCEGAYTGCWSWLSNSRSGVSAHYVVNDDGSEITQLVPESRKAWHISARYDCDRNNGEMCDLNGASSNNFTVGIEHAGSGSQSSWHPGLIDASTQLVCDITESHDIPRDSYHILGHGQLQPYNRTDPGPNWPWTAYLAEVRQRCGDASGGRTGSSGSTGAAGGTPPTPAEAGTETFVIDSNDSRNVPGRTRMEVSGNWNSSANVRGYYGTGYWWRTTGQSTDSAEFGFLSEAGCYAVDAWWTAGSDRSSAAPFILLDSAGNELGRTAVNQRTNGGRWNALGSFNFTTGWNTVALSRKTDASGVVVADAVRVRPSTGCSEPDVDPTPEPPATPIDWTIDSDNARNTDDYGVEYSNGWTSSSSTPGYFGTDYVWRQTGNSSDPLVFRFDLDAPKQLRVEARWTAGSNRSTAAPFVMFDSSSNEVGRAYVDQTANNATWVTLGTYEFTGGRNEVALSHWTSAGNVVVADAIRVREVR